MQIEGFPAWIIWFLQKVDWWLWKVFLFLVLKELDASEKLWFVFWAVVGLDVLFKLIFWVMSRGEDD